MWQILFGADAIARDETVRVLQASFANDNANGDAFNLTFLDSRASFSELQRSCDSAGFFVERRLIVARYYLGKADQRRKRQKSDDEEAEKLAAYLPELPEDSDLLFVEDELPGSTHPVLMCARKDASAKHLREFPLPDNVGAWIHDRVKTKGGEIQPPAAQLLSTRINRGNKNDRDHFAEDTRLYLRKLETELDKLMAYALGRSITVGDVQTLVQEEDVADIFKFTDAISQRRTAEAFTVVRGILARGESPLVVLSMIQRQTRLLISAKENERMSAQTLGEKLGMHPFPAGKALEQSRRFSMTDLMRAHRLVLDADEAIKTGAMDDVSALDVLIAELGEVNE